MLKSPPSGVELISTREDGDGVFEMVKYNKGAMVMHENNVAFKPKNEFPFKLVALWASVIIFLMIVIFATLASFQVGREVTKETMSQGQMREIMRGLMIYADANDEQYPDNIGYLIELDFIKPDVFVRSENRDALPAGKDWTSEQWADWANKNTDFIYVWPNKGSATGADEIILYEKFGPDHPHTQEGINIGFGDGHAKWYSFEKALPMLREQGLIE